MVLSTFVTCSDIKTKRFTSSAKGYIYSNDNTWTTNKLKACNNIFLNILVNCIYKAQYLSFFNTQKHPLKITGFLSFFWGGGGDLQIFPQIKSETGLRTYVHREPIQAA